jgi:cell division transport system permease protein
MIGNWLRARVASGGWPSLAGGADARLMPQPRLSGPMPWVIAIMVALTVIAAAAGLSLRNTARAVTAELAGGVTVQIVEPAAEVREAQSRAALARLRAMPEVVAARLAPAEEVEALVEPWLGEGASEGGGDIGAIPVPALIDVRLAGAASPERLAAPAARVDAQSTWLRPVADAIVSLQWLSLALVALLAFAMTSAVLLATRSSLGANRGTIEIVYLLGGTDRQIAGIFQRAIGIDAAAGGLLGFVLGLVAVLFLGRRFASLGAGLVDSGALGWQGWVVLALVPVAAVALAILTARISVLRALRRML